MAAGFPLAPLLTAGATTGSKTLDAAMQAASARAAQRVAGVIPVTPMDVTMGQRTGLTPEAWATLHAPTPPTGGIGSALHSIGTTVGAMAGLGAHDVAQVAEAVPKLPGAAAAFFEHPGRSAQQSTQPTNDQQPVAGPIGRLQAQQTAAESFGGGIPSFGLRLISGAAKGFAALPAAAVMEAQHPIGFAQGVLRQQGDYFSPLVHGDVGGFLHNVNQDPSTLAFDVAGGVGAAGKIASKLGVDVPSGLLPEGADARVQAATEAGGNVLPGDFRQVTLPGRQIANQQHAAALAATDARIGAVQNFLTANPGHEGALADLAQQQAARANLIENAPTGGVMHPTSSPSLPTRIIEHAYDRFSENHPDLPIVGSKARFANNMGLQAERDAARLRADVRPTTIALKGLNDGERQAVYQSRYGSEALPRSQDELAHFQQVLTDPASTLQDKQLAQQRVTEIQSALPHLETPNPKVENAAAALRAFDEQNTQAKIARGELTPEDAAARLQLHSRLVTGARFEQLPAEPEALAGARAQVSRLEKQVADTTVTREQAAPKVVEGIQQKLAARFTPSQIPLLETHLKDIDAERLAARGEGDHPRLTVPSGMEDNAAHRANVAAAIKEAKQAAIEGRKPDTGVIAAGLAHRFGDKVITYDGRVIGLSHEPRLQNLGSALSIARDQLGTQERRAETTYGHVPSPGQKADLRLVGGKPAGEGAFYVGDHPVFASRYGAAARGFLGKASKPGYTRQSTGALFEAGRQQTGTAGIKTDITTATKLEGARLERERAVGVAEPLSRDQPGGLKLGYRYVNPEGVKISRQAREAEIQASTPDEVARILSSKLFPTREELAQEGHNVDDVQALHDAGVRQVPDRIVKAQQARQLRTSPGKEFPVAGVRHLVSLLDVSNNVTRDALLFLKASYAPLVGAANVGMHFFQAGPMMVRNLHLLSGLDRRDWALGDAQMGMGGATGMETSTFGPLAGASKKLAYGQHFMAERMPRLLALVHESAQKGFDTPEKIKELWNAKPGTPLDEVRHGVAAAAEEAMFRFRGLSWKERAIVSRLLFIYPWLKADFRAGYRMPLDRPVQAAIAQAAGREASDKIEKQIGRTVSYLDGLTPLGPAVAKLGSEIVPTIRPVAASPFGSFSQIADIASSTAGGQKAPFARTVGSLIQPTVQTGISAAIGRDIGTGRQETPLQAVGHELSGVPLVHAAQLATQQPQTAPFSGDLSKQTMYVKEGGPWDAAKEILLGSGRPRDLNLPKEQQVAHGEERAAMSPEQKTVDDYQELRKSIIKGLQTVASGHGLVNGDVNHVVDVALKLAQVRDLNRLAWAKQNGVHATAGSSLDPLQKLKADLSLLVDKKVVPAQWAYDFAAHAAEAYRSGLKGQSWVTTQVNNLSSRFFGRDIIDQMSKALRHGNYKLKVP